MRRLTYIAAFGAALAGGGCFYTEPINEAPQADVRLSPQSVGPFHRGDQVHLSATKTSDPNDAQSELTVSWEARACNASLTDCDPEPFDGRSAATVFDDIVLDIPDERVPDDDGVIVPVQGVRLDMVVVDPVGATSEDDEQIAVQNREPTVALRLEALGNASSSPIGVPVQIWATPSDADPADEDTLAITGWDVTPPKRSGSEGGTWTELSGGGIELLADVTGTWTVTATVADQLGGTGQESIMVVVAEDAPPCIVGTSPPAIPDATYIVDALDGPRYFEITSVADDLDAHPPRSDDEFDDYLGRARFRWLVASPDTGGAWVEVSGNEVADYLVDPDAYDPGDRIDVRVEVDDRVGRTISCDPAEPTCSIAGDECLQRVTWGVEIR